MEDINFKLELGFFVICITPMISSLIIYSINKNEFYEDGKYSKYKFYLLCNLLFNIYYILIIRIITINKYSVINKIVSEQVIDVKSIFISFIITIFLINYVSLLNKYSPILKIYKSIIITLLYITIYVIIQIINSPLTIDFV